MTKEAIDGWMEQLGFVVRQHDEMTWLLVDDCGNERVATLNERVLWDALMAANAQFAEQPAGDAGLEAAAQWVDKRMQAYIEEHGHTDPDTGTVEFGRRSAGEEYVGELAEIAEGLRGLKTGTCKKPPAGWKCTRQSGHDGPCAAVND